MKKNIILSGFMGSGKSTVGKLLAAKQGVRLIDTDQYIEHKQGQTVTAIFQTGGEAYFRQLETECLTELLRTQPSGQIIAVGGGLPVKAENRRLMKQLGTVIYLEAPLSTLMERLKEDHTRPLLNCADPVKEAAGLLAFRHPLYVAAADLIIDTANKNLAEITQLIGKSLN